MKKLFYILSTVLMMSGCNFLDFDETSGLYNREDMYATFSNIKSMLTNIYGYLPNKDIVDVGEAMRECGSDDAEFGDPDASVQNFNNGNWSALSTLDTKWSLYNGIRSANEFLESFEKVDLSLYQYDGSYDLWQEHMKYFPYQARVLRAYFFFDLARRYGDIPMPLKMLSIEEANSIEKTPFADVIAFIVSECNDCIANLPATYVGLQNNEYGRATKGFAMALKAKALLYAASPLHNPSNDKSKWLAAAVAAQDIIDSGLYTLDPGQKVNKIDSPENIFIIMRSESSSFELYNFPPRFTEGKRTYISGTYPTQNLVDAFETENGYDITLTANGWSTADPDFDLSEPYKGRDPRFEQTILANGMTFKGAKIETFEGGADYSATRADLGTPTGYYLRKYIEESTSFVSEATVKNKHHWVVFRYAEALLAYAEAANEYFGNPDQSDGTLKLSAAAAINQVRANAGMPDVRATDYASFQDAVRREWRVEFAFEDHRFWDVRRWKIGGNTQTQIDGAHIAKVGNRLEYGRMMVERRTWSEKMNLYPIPQSELYVNTNLNPQNTGW
ncbi:MAG: RagB/SusD family nutrient uptake outer membrane protein [Bacteroidales bacterium]|nr:RagB/SusD family nutrient uptake outer membrane protein [Bacteroidales bacterium]